ncbi:hypothetical protein TNCV_3317261 [Trichonephila clavipes]|nr:hypothetical protein TNCV_3317261 [Trichonephila clavipes]
MKENRLMVEHLLIDTRLKDESSQCKERMMVGHQQNDVPSGRLSNGFEMKVAFHQSHACIETGGKTRGQSKTWMAQSWGGMVFVLFCEDHWHKKKPWLDNFKRAVMEAKHANEFRPNDVMWEKNIERPVEKSR